MCPLKNQANGKLLSCLTVDVEDWFHILDDPAVPDIKRWSSLECHLDKNLDQLLELLNSYSAKATFYWLAWLAERNKDLLRKCQDAGHEIASHGYAHVLAYEVGAKVFQQDITKAKDILEDLTGKPVRGFRAPGFGITKETPWAFDVIKESGYEYDSSVFPASRGHGGILGWPLGPHFIETQSGHLLEIPMSVVEIFGHRLSLFGGGYLRLASKLFINWGIGRLLARELPLVVYVHPREIDPDQPRLSLSRLRRFKCYVNLETTRPKLEWLCEAYSFHSMLDMVESYIKSSYFERRALPVVSPMGGYVEGEASPAVSRQTIRHGLLQVEKTMASFLKPEILGPESGGIDSQPLSANR